MTEKRKTGRPKGARPAYDVISIRVPPALKAALPKAAKAAGLSTAQYGRRVWAASLYMAGQSAALEK